MGQWIEDLDGRLINLDHVASAVPCTRSVDGNYEVPCYELHPATAFALGGPPMLGTVREADMYRMMGQIVPAGPGWYLIRDMGELASENIIDRLPVVAWRCENGVMAYPVMVDAVLGDVEDWAIETPTGMVIAPMDGSWATVDEWLAKTRGAKA